MSGTVLGALHTLSLLHQHPAQVSLTNSALHMRKQTERLPEPNGEEPQSWALNLRLPVYLVWSDYWAQERSTACLSWGKASDFTALLIASPSQHFQLARANRGGSMAVHIQACRI